MTDRLKQIWGDFAGRTSARLTSTDISHFARPAGEHRRGGDDEPAKALEAGRADRSDAVQAAFTALHSEIEEKAKRSRRRRRREPEASFTPGSAEFVPLGLDERLLADIKFTEARVKRGSSDYLSYAQNRQDQWKRKRKKFLGFF